MIVHHSCSSTSSSSIPLSLSLQVSLFLPLDLFLSFSLSLLSLWTHTSSYHRFIFRPLFSLAHHRTCRIYPRRESSAVVLFSTIFVTQDTYTQRNSNTHTHSLAKRNRRGICRRRATSFPYNRARERLFSEYIKSLRSTRSPLATLILPPPSSPLQSTPLSHRHTLLLALDDI